MSEINAIEKLREALKDCTSKAGEEPYQFDTYWITANACDMLIDEIEREHEQRVAELKGAICERDGRIGIYERRNTNLNDALKVICKRFGVSTEWSAEDTARKVLEALESQYMELPTDADGVPIHIGDYLQLSETRGYVVALIYCPRNELPWEWQCDSDSDWYNTAFTLHAEPRTVEDVLRDVWKEALDYAKSDMWRSPDEVFAERAEEIREMLGGDAE